MVFFLPTLNLVHKGSFCWSFNALIETMEETMKNRQCNTDNGRNNEEQMVQGGQFRTDNGKNNVRQTLQEMKDALWFPLATIAFP